MIRYIIAALLTGLLFGIMDGIIHANPYAEKILACYKPLARESINVPMGILIDIFYGFIISVVFFALMPAFPSEIGIIKGIIFGFGMWFFRVLMGVVSDWMMYDIPSETINYLLLTGLVEMLILGIVNGLILKR